MTSLLDDKAEPIEIQTHDELEKTSVYDAPELTSDKIKMLETQVENYKKIIGITIRLTNANDWVDQNGKPYLQSSGAEKIAVPFKVSLTNKQRIKHERTDEKGSYYFYEYKCVAKSELLGRSIEAEGFRSVRDPFFSKKGGQVIPISEITESDIMLAAYSNMTMNAITRLIGIRNLTWDILEDSGIKKGSVSSIKYDKEISGADLTDEEKTKLSAMLDKIGDWLLMLNNGDKDQAAKQLEKLTVFKGRDGNMVKGKTSLRDLSPKQIPVIYGRVQEIPEIAKLLKEEADKGGQK